MTRTLLRLTGLLQKCSQTSARQFHRSTKNFNKKEDEFNPSQAFKDFTPREIGRMNDYKPKVTFEDPFLRTAKILKNDMKWLGYKFKELMGYPQKMKYDLQFQCFPTHTDVVIIGGGAIGSSIAFWLKQRAPNAMHVTVIERDVSYSETSNGLSVGGLHQQFSLPENVDMSLFGAEFLRNIDKHLSIDGQPVPDVHFQPYGYLFLVSQNGAATLKENYDMQCKMGARNILLSPQKLIERFPWLNTDGVELGCLGLEFEGWFDPWSFINALKKKSINLGAEYIQGNVVGFEFQDQPNIEVPSSDGKYEQIEKVIVELPNGEIRSIKFGYCILAAGASSGAVAKMARIGECNGLLSVPLPVEPRKRYIYRFHAPEGPSLNTPLVVDPLGVYFRREGLSGTYVAGRSTVEDVPPIDNLDVDYDFFNEKVWPVLAERVPAFEKLKLKTAWASCNDYNTMDENGVIGPHPFYHNLFIASGFSRHGIQHTPAVGRAIMELLIDGEFKTINLSRFGFDRLCLGQPLEEKSIV